MNKSTKYIVQFCSSGRFEEDERFCFNKKMSNKELRDFLKKEFGAKRYREIYSWYIPSDIYWHEVEHYE